MKRPLAVVLLAVLLACGPEPPAEVAEPAAPPPVDFDCRFWRPLESGTGASFRGLSAVDDQVVWVSGTSGTWGLSLDGGSTWSMRTIPGAETLDFRDVDAFDSQTAYLMSAGPGELSRIYKTVDGGDTWTLQWVNGEQGFFDGMAFWDTERGLVYGDPVDGRFEVLATQDGGATWTRVQAERMPGALPDEAGFAASGSGLAVLPGGHAWFGTGGPDARVFRSTDYGQSWTAVSTPMLSGSGPTGIFSLAFSDPMTGIVVGGDYTQPEATARNAARTTDGGVTWSLLDGAKPSGYRSGVAFAPQSGGAVVIAVGTSGADFSRDGGTTWEPMGEPTLNAVAFGESRCAGWAVGPDGGIFRLGE
ncbi:MAG: hypothetical protein AAF657_19790 [Acidobacteriota bacterium]